MKEREYFELTEVEFDWQNDREQRHHSMHKRYHRVESLLIVLQSSRNNRKCSQKISLLESNFSNLFQLKIIFFNMKNISTHRKGSMIARTILLVSILHMKTGWMTDILQTRNDHILVNDEGNSLLHSLVAYRNISILPIDFLPNMHLNPLPYFVKMDRFFPLNYSEEIFDDEDNVDDVHCSFSYPCHQQWDLVRHSLHDSNEWRNHHWKENSRVEYFD